MKSAPLFFAGEYMRLTGALFARIEGVCQIIDGERRVIVLIEIFSNQMAGRLSHRLVWARCPDKSVL